ncbi:hypothetical protein FQZ97_857640 [compost metagenome]
MGRDEIVEGEHLVDGRLEQSICRQLVDVLQGALHRFLIRLDAELRMPGEVQHAVTEKLQMLLERGTGRESRIVATVDAVQDQFAARRGDIAKQFHLRPGALVENDLDTLAVGITLDFQHQVLLFGDDDLVGTQLAQELAIPRFAGGGDDLGAKRLGQLHRLRSQAMAGFGNQHVLAGFQLGQVDQGEISEQQGGVMHAGFQRRQRIRVASQRITRHQHQIAPGRVAVGGAGREAGNRRTEFEVVNALAQSLDGARQLEAHTGWQLRLLSGQVLPPQYVFPAQANGLNAHQHFAGTGLRGWQLFALKHVSVAEFMEADHAGHR